MEEDSNWNFQEKEGVVIDLRFRWTGRRERKKKRSLRSLRKEIREMAAPLLGFLSDIYDYAGLTSLLHFDWFIALAARGRL